MNQSPSKQAHPQAGSKAAEVPEELKSPSPTREAGELEELASTVANSALSSPELSPPASPRHPSPSKAEEVPASSTPDVHVLNLQHLLHREAPSGTAGKSLGEAEARRQAEYYFSFENLCHDTYLRSRMDVDGWVSLGEIGEFPRMRRLGLEVRALAAALMGLPAVEVSRDLMYVRSSSAELRKNFPNVLFASRVPEAPKPEPAASLAAPKARRGRRSGRFSAAAARKEREELSGCCRHADGDDGGRTRADEDIGAPEIAAWLRWSYDA